MNLLNKSINYATLIIGTPYEWWNVGDMRGDRAPFWAANETVPLPEVVRSQSCTCTGLINLMRRAADLSIPGADNPQDFFPGGTVRWFEYLEGKKVLSRIDVNLSYPLGTLCIRPYVNEVDQGHVAVVFSQTMKSVLNAKVIHSCAKDPTPKPEQRVPYGVKVDQNLETSHSWSQEGYYTHVCLPEGWLSRDS